jgi:hypothetical protein
VPLIEVADVRVVLRRCAGFSGYCGLYALGRYPQLSVAGVATEAMAKENIILPMVLARSHSNGPILSFVAFATLALGPAFAPLALAGVREAPFSASSGGHGTCVKART